MIVKEDLVTWFRKLESYKRIDIMCTLLNMCLPFELRFLGTCLEELGRRDAQELRGAELRLNDPQVFVADIGSFQTGQPTEVKIRRKMALYLALMRASNRTGVHELYKTLDRWGDSDFTKFNDGDPLQELLLTYTMATNHPVFSFEQRLKCGDILTKITSGKAHLNQESPATTSPIPSPLTSSTFSVQQHHPTSPPPPFSSATFQQSTTQIINPQIPNPILMAFPPTATMTSMIPMADPSALTMSVDSMPSHIAAVPPSMIQIPTDFTTPPPWLRYPPAAYPMVQIDAQFPPQATSPHLSQPTSPAHSRTGSPSRQSNQVQQTSSQAQQQQMMPNPVTSQMQTQSLHRNNRQVRHTRPSAETTPPPLQSHQQSSHQASQGSGTIFMGNDIMVQNIKNFEEINMDGAISQLQSLTMRNGYNRPPNTISRQKPNWPQGAPVISPMSYTMHMVDPSAVPINMNRKAAGSDSGGSSTGEASPPPMQPDPNAGLHGNPNQTQSSGSLRNKQPLNLSRLNGGKHGAGGSSSSGTNNNNNNNIDFNNGSQSNISTIVTSNSSGNLSLLIGGQMHNFPAYRTLPPQQQPRQFSNQNGELMYTLHPQFLPTQTPVVVTTVSQRASPSAVPGPTPYPTNKMVQSCFNCGSTSHTGLNCSEASMEDVTRNAVYKLDYTSSARQQLQLVEARLEPGLVTTSTSSNRINQTASMTHPANNNEPDSSITVIDLTQDSTSSSSSSSTSSIHGMK